MTEEKKGIEIPEKLKTFIAEQIQLGVAKALEGMVPVIPDADSNSETELEVMQNELLIGMGYQKEELEKARKDYFGEESGDGE